MTTTLLVIIIVMALALFFLWPIPYLAIVVIAMHPVLWGLLALALGGIVAALTFLRMQPNPFNEDDADRTESRR
jgi:hypothetical protein